MSSVDPLLARCLVVVTGCAEEAFIAQLAKHAGTIIHIGSSAALWPVPAFPVYSAAKHGLRGWSLDCHEALRQHGIKVVLLNPGDSAWGCCRPGTRAEHHRHAVHACASVCKYASDPPACRGFSLPDDSPHMSAGYVRTPMTRDVQGVDHSKMIQPSDVAEAAMLPFNTSPSCLPFEIRMSSALPSDDPEA